MKKGCLVTIIILVALAAIIIYGLSTAFGPDYDKADIKQNIGGTLICNSVYNSDQHSWQYDISYKYKLPNNKLINIGNGTYYGREWKKDEQLVKYKSWTILKTGGWIGTDKVIVGNVKTNKWIEHEFTPESIERDSVWTASKIHSLLNYCCSESFVDHISNGFVIVHYKFRTSEQQVDKYQQKGIYYLIDDMTGKLKMARVQ